MAIGHQMGRKREVLMEVGVHAQAWYFTSAQEAITGADKAIKPGQPRKG